MTTANQNKPNPNRIKKQQASFENNSKQNTTKSNVQPAVSFDDALALWWQIGILSFGGPTAQIALMHRMVVEEKKWLNETQFLNILNFCMLLPGPEAMQVATYLGWRMHGLKGGLCAGLLFVIPGAVVILALAACYAAFGSAPLFEAVFVGIKACVVIIVIQAFLRISKKNSKASYLLDICPFIFYSNFCISSTFSLHHCHHGIIRIYIFNCHSILPNSAMTIKSSKALVKPL